MTARFWPRDTADLVKHLGVDMDAVYHRPVRLNASGNIDRDELLAMEAQHPTHGQELTAVFVRQPFAKSPSLILVDSAQIKAAKATIAAASAEGSSASAIARAVRTASYTSTPAAASSSLPMRCNTCSLASNASRPSITSLIATVLFWVGLSAVVRRPGRPL